VHGRAERRAIALAAELDDQQPDEREEKNDQVDV
jgi:hypothetical protein